MKTTPASPTILDLVAGGGFHTTRWTRVLQAREPTREGLEALRDLCAAYYAPVIAFLRRRGHEPDAARELAHEFFAGVLEGGAFGGADRGQGRFRSYLLGAVKHFLSNQRVAEQCQRRGGGREILSLEAQENASPALAIAEDERLSPDAAFDRQWALTTLDLALQTLRRECVEDGRADLFDRLRSSLTGEAGYGDQTELAASLGLSVGSLKATVFRLKRRYRVLVKAGVAATLEDDRAVEEEMGSLFAALRS